MAVSKGYYPYSCVEKFNYYIGKIFCASASLFGASLYARIFCRTNYLTKKEIKNYNINGLKNLVICSNKNRKWHFNYLLFNVVLINPLVYGVYHTQIINTKQYFYATVVCCILLVNDIYGMIANMYNSIRYSQAIKQKKCLHAKIYGNIHIDTMDNIVMSLVSKEKCTWLLYSCTNNNDKTFVIYNAYYQELIFIFQMENIAMDFMKELNILSLENIDYLLSHPKDVLRLQREFVVKKRISTIIPAE